MLLRWTATHPNTPDGYRIYRSTSENGNYSLITELTPWWQSNYTDSQPKAGGTYYYKIEAFKGDKKSLMSNAVSAEVVEEGAMQSVRNFALVNISGSAVQLKWSYIHPNTPDGYRIYRSMSQNGIYTPIAEVTPWWQEGYTDSEKKIGGTYYYKIQSYKGSISGPLSQAVSAAVQGPSDLEEVTRFRVEAIDTMTVYLRWDYIHPNTPTGYKIYRSNSQYGTYDLIANLTPWWQDGYSDAEPKPNGTYYYKICAYYNDRNAIMSQPISAIVNIPVSGELQAPKNLRVQMTEGQNVYLSWDYYTPYNSVDGYRVYKDLGNGGYMLIGIITKYYNNFFYDTSEKADGEYRYAVSAVKNGVESPLSAAAVTNVINYQTVSFVKTWAGDKVSPDGLTVQYGGSGASTCYRINKGYTTGKYYFEAKYIGDSGSWNNIGIITNVSYTSFYAPAGEEYGYSFSFGRGKVVNGDIVGVAVDYDNGKIYYRLNGVWTNGIPNVSGGDSIIRGKTYFPAVECSSGNTSWQGIFNGFTVEIPQGYRPY